MGRAGKSGVPPAAVAYGVAGGLVVLTLLLVLSASGPGGAGHVTPSPQPIATPAASAAATPATTPAPPPAKAPAAFDGGRAMEHIRVIASGQRVGGSAGEWRAVEYARDRFASLGYQVDVVDVPIPNGRTSHNVVARTADATGPIVVLGGHIDTKAPSPGADDNASGCGAVLELARDFAGAAPAGTDLRFVLFGNEELIGDGDSDHHHFGSRAYARSLTSAERDRFAAMISIDMIGYGPDFRVRTMGVGTRALADRLLETAEAMDVPLAYLRDPGKPSGWSDHEPFERAGLPAAWLEWRDDPNTHTTRDTYDRLDRRKVETTGRLVHGWLTGLDAADLSALVRTR